MYTCMILRKKIIPVASKLVCKVLSTERISLLHLTAVKEFVPALIFFALFE
jgi:hypothetical protein